MIDNRVASHTLELLKRMDTNSDRMLEGLEDLAEQAGSTESKIASCHSGLSRASVKDDRVETRLDRIEERLDLVDAPD